MNIIWWLIVGLIAGLIARAVVPGRDSLGWVGTIVLGLIGSVVGGFLMSMISSGKDADAFNPAGLLGSIIGAIVALLVWRAVNNRHPVS